MDKVRIALVANDWYCPGRERMKHGILAHHVALNQLVEDFDIIHT